MAIPKLDEYGPMFLEDRTTKVSWHYIRGGVHINLALTLQLHHQTHDLVLRLTKTNRNSLDGFPKSEYLLADDLGDLDHNIYMPLLDESTRQTTFLLQLIDREDDLSSLQLHQHDLFSLQLHQHDLFPLQLHHHEHGLFPFTKA
jgi:hypothetical protein